MPEQSIAELRETMRAVAKETVRETLDQLGLYSNAEVREFRELMIYMANARKSGASLRENVAKGVVDKLITVLVAGLCAMAGVYATSKGLHLP